ncbi:MAG: hypothetical protein J5644_03920 [Bacteroidales bacterium]|nr:hypothetical protein [Bacteroidales bacterium]
MKKITIDSVTPWECPSKRYSCLECEYNAGMIIDTQLYSELKVQCDYTRLKEEKEALTVGDYIEK